MKKIILIPLIILFGLVGVYKLMLDRQHIFEKEITRQFTNTIIEIANQQLGASDTNKLIAGMTYTMSGSGVSSSATSLTLASLTLPQNGYKIQDSDLSTTFYVTLEPGNRTRQEIVSCTTVVQNAAGTATLSGCTRGLSPISPYTASSTLQFAHAGGTQVVFSDPPQIFQDLLILSNNATSTNFLVFSSTTPPYYDYNPTWALWPTTTLASKGYVDDVATSGAPDMSETVKGLGEQATGLQAASSTATDNTTAPLVLTTKYSTSSPGTNSNWVVITNHIGKIAQAFFDLTQSFTWTGAHTFNSATTTIARLSLSSATTSVAGVSVTLPSVTTKFPSAQGASSTVWLNNGSGTLLPDFQDWQLLGETTLTGSAGTTTVSSIPARQALRILVYVASMSASGDTTYLAFNTDYSATYGYQINSGSTTAATKGSTSKIQINLSGFNTTAGAQTHDIFVVNVNGGDKRVSSTGSQARGSGSSAIPSNPIQGVGVWNNTAQVTTVEITTGSAVTFGAGTYIKVYGTKD